MRIYSKEEAKSEITRLVDAFGENIDFYKSDKYKEANLEDEYLKPFLRYLNWNISNEGITNIANREVIVQAKGKRGKEPDYLLQLEGKPKFYIEAKHPKYKLSKDIGYIWQAYSYAYSTQASTERKKVDFSLLTDFEEFCFFDCTFAASKQTVNNFVTIDWKFKDYETEFDNLWNLFEKENIRKGSLKSLYLNEKKVKENRIPPDKAFLNDLDNEKTGWRIQIAKEIKKYNQGFSAEYITRAVQLIIDRFIFIKVLSDREIEDDYLSEIIINIDKALMKSEGGLLIDSCKEVFSKLNRVYNGSIFAPKPELESIHISNKVLKNVLSDLLPENSRYNFKQLPVEVLGTIYEQFLGKVIETTEKRVSVEYKPEVRKAGGVYYTPQYIVEYIVENTVGEKLKECKSIEDVFVIKICDPACGSGSFLLGAYDRLVRWCTDHYTKTIKPGAAITKKNAEHVYLDEDGQYRLTSKLRRELLRNCIFGVDIDNQAVEVAITSLSLKALEGTRHDELYAEVDLFHETVLPKLEDNIKCGNSLIGMDIFDGKLEFSKEEEKKLNPFDWGKSFPGVFKNGGFDCVIGNPPYGAELTEMSRQYLDAEFLLSNTDTAALLIVKKKKLLRLNGLGGFIVPKPFIYSSNWQKTRDEVLPDIIKVIDVSKVWKEVKLEMVIEILKKTSESSKFYMSGIRNGNEIIEQGVINKDLCTKYGFILSGVKPEEIFIANKIQENSIPLNNLVINQRGGMLQKGIQNEPVGLAVFGGKQVSRYFMEIEPKGYIPENQCSDAKAYVKDNSLLVQNIVAHIMNPVDHIQIIATIPFDKNIIILDTINQLENKSNYKIQFLLGVLCSNFCNWYVYRFIFGKAIRTMHFDSPVTSRIPFPILDFNTPEDVKKHDQLVALVDTMLSINKELHQSETPHTEQQQNQIKDRIAYTDRQIDQLVYKLYNLTPEEILIVEGIQ
jgi:type I restriction-modification system DNA methylase subunit